MSGHTHEDNLRLLDSLIRLFLSLVKLSANSQDMFPDKEADVANTFFRGDAMPKKQMPL